MSQSANILVQEKTKEKFRTFGTEDETDEQILTKLMAKVDYYNSVKEQVLRSRIRSHDRKTDIS